MFYVFAMFLPSNMAVLFTSVLLASDEFCHAIYPSAIDFNCDDMLCYLPPCY